MNGLKRDLDFHCHATVDYKNSDNGRVTGKSKICAGFAVIAEEQNHPTQMMRICERIGLYDAKKLDRKALVHKTASAFIKAQLP